MGEDGGVKRFVVQIPSAAEVEQRSSVREQPFNFFRPSSSSASAPTSSAASGGLPQSSTSQAAGQGQSQRQSQGQSQGQEASTFTEAFSFLRNSEFYSPPPPPRARPPAAAVASSSPLASGSGALPSTDVRNPKKEELNAAAAQTGQARNSILVSRRQQGNSVLKHIRNARWMFADIVPDYILGQNSCALYLSLRYHLLHPDYIYFRIRELQKSFRLRVVLCYVDVDDVIKPLHEVTKTCILHDCCLLCAWSQEECARYLETIKVYENKPADYIQERTDSDYLSRLTNLLTTVRHVNKTDVVTLGSTFKTLTAIFNSSMEDLARCPGIGERKVKRLYDAFNEPFKRNVASKLPRQKDGVSSSGNPQGQAQASEGPSGQKTTEDNGNGNEEALPSSKLINRDGEASVGEALKAVRKRSRKSLGNEAQTASVTLSEDLANSTDKLQTESDKELLAASHEDDYVNSLAD